MRKAVRAARGSVIQAEQSPTKQEWSAKAGWMVAVAATSNNASASISVFIKGPPFAKARWLRAMQKRTEAP
jgi:hypothetical protein